MRIFALLALGVALVAGQGAAQDFPTEAWIAEGRKPLHEIDRSRMAGLAQERLRPGMAETEVTALLGEPDRRSGAELVYELGIAPYGVDQEWLVVVLDEEGRVAETRLSRG